MSAARNIPTIDLSDYLTGEAGSRRRFVRTLGEGLVEFGFLNVEGHGIDPDLVRGTYGLWQRFFDLPEEVKRKYVTSTRPSAPRSTRTSTSSRSSARRPTPAWRS